MSITNCQNCGACCRAIGLPPFLFGEILALPEDLKSEMIAWQEEKDTKENSGEPCVWYDSVNHVCKHYDHRPMICRDFQVGDTFCINYRRVYNINEA